jgi:hypothetical protein
MACPGTHRKLMAEHRTNIFNRCTHICSESPSDPLNLTQVLELWGGLSLLKCSSAWVPATFFQCSRTVLSKVALDLWLFELKPTTTKKKTSFDAHISHTQ